MYTQKIIMYVSMYVTISCLHVYKQVYIIQVSNWTWIFGNLIEICYTWDCLYYRPIVSQSEDLDGNTSGRIVNPKKGNSIFFVKVAIQIHPHTYVRHLGSPFIYIPTFCIQNPTKVYSPWSTYSLLLAVEPCLNWK